MTHPPAIVITSEGGGHVATCECGWTRWSRSQSTASATSISHAAKCKGVTEKPALIAPKRAAAQWNDREGATWIDNL